MVVMVEREDRDREGQVINGHATTFSEITHGAAKVLSLFSHFLVLWSHAKINQMKYSPVKLHSRAEP